MHSLAFSQISFCSLCIFISRSPLLTYDCGPFSSSHKPNCAHFQRTTLTPPSPAYRPTSVLSPVVHSFSQLSWTEKDRKTQNNMQRCALQQGLPRWLSGKEATCQLRRRRFKPWVGKSPWRREWQSTPIFLPGKSHGQGSLVGYGSWDCKESDTTERLSVTLQERGIFQWIAVDSSPSR